MQTDQLMRRWELVEAEIKAGRSYTEATKIVAKRERISLSSFRKRLPEYAPSFFEGNPQLQKRYFKLAKDAVEVTIPKLNEMVFEQAELAGVPFSTFIANRDADDQTANNSLVLRGYVRSWMNQVTSEYDRIGLIDRLSDRGETTRAA
jgi:hypothetical protein